MPIFEYVCRECDHGFEAIVSGAGQPTCPSCSSNQLDKQLSVFAVGATGPTVSKSAAVSACGSCGDPRGAGACSLN